MVEQTGEETWAKGLRARGGGDVVSAPLPCGGGGVRGRGSHDGGSLKTGSGSESAAPERKNLQKAFPQ